MRQKMLQNNKAGKYLLYAIGEIVLIVIGIWIALGVNNYSEKQKSIQQSRVYLNNMLEDLASDTLYLSRMLPKLKEQLSAEEWLLNKESFTEEDLDSIKIALSSINWSFEINNRSFLSMQAANGPKLLGYEDLYSAISDYYVITQNRVRKNNQMELESRNRETPFEQVINQNFLISNRKYTDYSGFQVGLELKRSARYGNIEKVFSMLNKIESQNALYEKYARHNYLFLALHFGNREAKKLIRQVKTHIEKG